MEYDLTVITVCWNVRAGVLATVENVLEQKAKRSLRIEHLFVDGASTDGTPELLEGLKREGKIEAYLSEPDKGIYDAMNKGIELARGKVLFFLNADDTLNNETDLAEFVLPIVRNECDATCGLWRNSKRPESVYRPTLHLAYLNTPCSHQAFFAAKDWYLKLGGYDTAAYRCTADGDFMWSMFAAGARFQTVQKEVVLFQDGGFSTNATIRFLDEIVLMAYSHRSAVAEYMQKDRNYARFALVNLFLHFVHYPPFVQSGGKRVAETLARLRELCTLFRQVRKGHPIDCMALKLLEGPCARACEAGRFSGWRRLLYWRLPALFLTMPKGKEYAEHCPPLPFSGVVAQLLGAR